MFTYLKFEVPTRLVDFICLVSSRNGYRKSRNREVSGVSYQRWVGA